MKKRLFQSVLGHRLLSVLTLNTIKQELREFVLETCGELGKALIVEIECLDKGRFSSWSKIKINSQQKLSAILKAIEALPKKDLQQALGSVDISDVDVPRLVRGIQFDLFSYNNFAH